MREHMLRFLLREQIIEQPVYNEHLSRVYEGRWERGTALLDAGVLDASRLRTLETQLSNEIMLACFGWTRTSFRFHTLPDDHTDLFGPLALDPFMLYARWLDEEVSVRRIRRQIRRLHERHVRLSHIGAEQHEQLERLLVHHPTLRTAIEESWQVQRLLGQLDSDADVVSRTILTLYHLGAVELLRSLDEMALFEPLDTASSDDEEVMSLDPVYSMAGGDEVPSPFPVTNHQDLGTLRRLVDAEMVRLEGACTPHEVLGILPAATTREIQDAHGRLMRFYDPENFVGASEDGMLMRQILHIRTKAVEAFDALKTPEVHSSGSFPALVSASVSTDGFTTAPLTMDQDDQWRLARILFEDGMVYLKLGEHREALSHFRHAYRRAPDDPRILAYLGWSIYLESPGDGSGREEGMRMLISASRMRPDEDEIYVLLGHVHCRNGQPRRGAEMYQKALLINPDNEDAQRALESG